MNRVADLRSRLDAHVPADPREDGFVQAMRELLAHGERTFDRHHVAPGHFTASAFVVSPDFEELLLVLHGKLGLWLQPGGHVEPDDPTLLDAARREVREEVGLDDIEVLGPGLLDVDVHAIPESAREPSHRHFDVRFLFRATTREARAGDDAAAVRWVPLGRPDAIGGDESVRRAVRRISAMRAGGSAPTTPAKAR